MFFTHKYKEENYISNLFIFINFLLKQFHRNKNEYLNNYIVKAEMI